MNRKALVIALIFSIISLPLVAQVNKQVEVTKSYIPQIEPATKLTLEPDMSDTVRLSPEIDYSVTPKTIETTLSSRLYKPATVTYWEFNRPKRFYAKAGVGYPLSSVADFYVSSSNPNTNYFVGYLNHEGEYNKIKNDYGDKLSALNSQNRVGLAGGIKLAERALEGEFNYDIDTWSRYATLNSITPRPLYQSVALQGRYGDEFIDFRSWNFSVDVDAKHFWSRESHNTLLGVGANVGKDLSSGRLLVSLDYDYVGGSYNYLNNSVMLGATYLFTTGDWSWEVGGKYCYDALSLESEGKNKSYILPHFVLRGNLSTKIQPFLEVLSEFNRNNYYSLVDCNPYVLEGFAADQNSIEYDIRAGIQGAIGRKEKVSYRLFASYSLAENARFWTLHEDYTSSTEAANYYSALFGRLYSFTVGGDFEYRPIGGLKFDFGLSATSYSAEKMSGVSVARPYAGAYLGAEYSHNRFKLGVSADLKGVSYTTLYVTDAAGVSSTSNIQLPITVNLKAFAEVEIKEDIVVFVEGRNLANSKLYEWMGYRENGIGAMAGVKLQF